jgi:hypothetical protein
MHGRVTGLVVRAARAVVLNGTSFAANAPLTGAQARAIKRLDALLAKGVLKLVDGSANPADVTDRRLKTKPRPTYLSPKQKANL